MSHDIGNTRGTLMLGHVKGPSWSSLPCSSRSTTPAQVAARYGVHRAWVYKLKARFEAEGDTALEPRSRRPKTSPGATPPETIELVLRLRKQLAEDGHDAGPDTLRWHLGQHHGIALSRATIHRILTRHGAVTPEPKKRPKSSYTRFEAAMPNETWQSDFTHLRFPPDRRGIDNEDRDAREAEEVRPGVP